MEFHCTITPLVCQCIFCVLPGIFPVFLRLFSKARARKLQIAVCRVVCWLLRRGSANRFSRGEAVAKIGYSEPILVTEVECGQECIVMVSVSGLAKGNALVGLSPVRHRRLSPAFHFRPSVRTGAPSPREKGWPPSAANSSLNSNLHPSSGRVKTALPPEQHRYLSPACNFFWTFAKNPL